MNQLRELLLEELCRRNFAATNFLDAIENWERRYSDARLKSPHHSEDLIFLDRSGGALIALTSRQRVGDSTFLHASELEIQLPVILAF